MQRRRIKQLEVAATELAEQVEETISLINEELKDCCAVCDIAQYGRSYNLKAALYGLKSHLNDYFTITRP